jgi:hypothetical protein
MTEDLSQKIITQDAVKSVILSALVHKATDNDCYAEHPVLAHSFRDGQVTGITGQVSDIAQIAAQAIMPLITDMMKSQNVALSMMERWSEEHIRFGVITPEGTTEMLPCADWCYACKMERLKEFEGREAERKAYPVQTFVCGPDTD